MRIACVREPFSQYPVLHVVAERSDCVHNACENLEAVGDPATSAHNSAIVASIGTTPSAEEQYAWACGAMIWIACLEEGYTSGSSDSRDTVERSKEVSLAQDALEGCK